MSPSREEAPRIWTPANVVTVVRICLVPVFVVALLSPWPDWLGMEGATDEVKALIAAAIFVVISCTDWLDGYLARKRGEVTDFGKFMDPLADKILVAAALLALVELQALPSWPVLIILCREFIVSGVRMLAASKGVVIAASWLGKAKTVAQIVAIILFIVKDVFYPSVNEDGFTSPLYLVAWLVMLVALALTVVSLLDYLVKARGLMGLGRTPVPPSERCDALAARIVSQGSAEGATVACAESLTGGLVTAALTDIPGSSAVVRGAVVSYATDVKRTALGVDGALLDAEGPVDGDVALQMAQGARERLGAAFGVATTGIAGPGGAQAGKPVGTVWIAVAGPEGAATRLSRFEGSREQVREQSVATALQMLADAMDGRLEGGDEAAS